MNRFRCYCGTRAGVPLLMCGVVSLWLVTLCCSFGSAAESKEFPLRQALDTIVGAQPEGIDSAKVSNAWKIVAQADPQQIDLILQTMDKSDGLAVNWLSMAIDRIVERHGTELLPVDRLRQTALDTNHRLQTRKMAIDLLARIDRQQVATLQDALMDDPEAELRRPAIEKAIAQARESVTQGVAIPEQTKKWLALLTVARDQDQILLIARELGKIGHEVDLAAQFGYLTDWYIIGPFDNTDGKNYDTPFPPEKLTLDQYEKIVAGTAETVEGKSGPLQWKRVQARARDGDVNLNEKLEKLRDVLAYGATVFISDQAQQVEVRLRIQNSFKIWLNGKLLMEQPVGHTGNSFDQYVVRADLVAGKNLFVVKSCQVDMAGTTAFFDNWHFSVRVCDSTGGAIVPANRTAVHQEDSIKKGAEQ